MSPTDRLIVAEQNDLLLADRYYTGFGIIALLIKQGTPLVFSQRNTAISDSRRGQRLGPKDHIIHLIKPKKKPVWMSDQGFAELSDVMDVRECSVKGVVYVTTLLMVEKEIAVNLLAYNLIRTNIARGACIKDKEPR